MYDKFVELVQRTTPALRPAPIYPVTGANALGAALVAFAVGTYNLGAETYTYRFNTANERLTAAVNTSSMYDVLNVERPSVIS